MADIEHDELNVSWEDVDRLTEKLGDEKDAYEWFDSLLATEGENFRAATAAGLVLWTEDGRMAFFRMGYRIIVSGLLTYAQRVTQSELKEDY